MAQLIVVVQVFVAERNLENPLTDQSGDFVFDQVLAPGVLEAGRLATFWRKIHVFWPKAGV